MTVPRLLRRLLVPGRIYPLYGVHHLIAGMLAGFAYSRMFQLLFGDSSGIVHYFRWLGIRQPDVRQTGSNFGTDTAYETPFELEFGSGSMVSDGFKVVNFETGSGAFRIVPACIGNGSFIGNSIVYPAGARTGDNCLLGTKVMVPIDGEMRENTGLLGSPAFEIPRQVVSDRKFDPVPSNAEGHARLRAKNRFNLRTALLHLAWQWALLAGILLVAYGSIVIAGFNLWALVLTAVLMPAYVLAHGVAAERFSSLAIRFEPHRSTIHEPYFWWIERHWKLGETVLDNALTGTPFRGMLLRLLGMRVGSRLFDEGANIPEKMLVEIGDNCAINAGTVIQAHSLEDGLFKSDRIVIGDNCSIGPSGFVHYGVRMSEGSSLAPDAFLMKGATTEPGSRWVGNPASPQN